MIQHPAIAAALAEQRRAAFMAEAETARLARAARAARMAATAAPGPARWFAPRRHPRHAAARRGLARLRPARARRARPLGALAGRLIQAEPVSSSLTSAISETSPTRE